MSDIKLVAIVASAIVLLTATLAVAFHFSDIRAQETARLCIQSDRDVINGNCIRSVK